MTRHEGLTRRDKMPSIVITEQDIKDGGVKIDCDPIELAKTRFHWAPAKKASIVTDVGSACYKTREGSGKWLYVDPNSIIEHPLLYDVIVGSMKAAIKFGRADTFTALTDITRILANGPEEETWTANSLLNGVTKALRSKEDLGLISRTSAANRQVATIDVLQCSFDVERDEIVQGVRRFKYRREPRSEMTVLPTKAARHIAKASADHFVQMANALMESRDIPFDITVADQRFLFTAAPQTTGNIARYVPLDERGRPPTDCIYDENFKLRSCPAYDIPEEFLDTDPRFRSHFRRTFEIERKRQKVANATSTSDVRVIAISDALLSFVACTYFDTGANRSTLQGVPSPIGQQGGIRFSEVANAAGRVRLRKERSVSGYVYETTKPRAGNKKIAVLFSSQWAKRILPVYAQFRKYLEDQGFDVPDALLFTIAKHRATKEVSSTENPLLSQRVRNSKTHVLHHFLEQHGLDTVTTTQARNFKSAELSKIANNKTSADILGHTLETARERYNRVSEVDAQLQLAGVLNSISSIPIIVDEGGRDRRLIGGGQCTKEDDRKVVAVESDVLGAHAPNCRTRTGCWMCPFFAVHADETDYWKLRSYLYVISELQACSDDFYGVDEVHKPIVSRLTAVLQRIFDSCEDKKEIYLQIDDQVNNGRLHSVYAELVDTYTMLEIL